MDRSTPWERELIQARNELQCIERDEALYTIALLMRRHGISIDDLRYYQVFIGKSSTAA